MVVRRAKGFTLVEIMVVIGIIALLMAVLMPTLSKAREQARRVVCRSNTRQIGLAMLLYAENNDNMLPLHAAYYWLQDASYYLTDLVIESGGEDKTFYCPSQKEKGKNPDNPSVWQFSQETNVKIPEPDTIIDRKMNYRVTGYFWLQDDENPRPYKTFAGDYNGNPIPSLRRNWPRKTTDPIRTTSQALVSDVVISINNNPRQFTEIPAGLWEREDVRMLDSTNHVKGSDPMGGNIFFMDGSAEWRDFRDMHLNYYRPYGSIRIDHWW